MVCALWFVSLSLRPSTNALVQLFLSKLCVHHKGLSLKGQVWISTVLSGLQNQLPRPTNRCLGEKNIITTLVC